VYDVRPLRASHTAILPCADAVVASPPSGAMVATWLPGEAAQASTAPSRGTISIPG
jgi:hypothetical protein